MKCECLNRRYFIKITGWAAAIMAVTGCKSALDSTVLASAKPNSKKRKDCDMDKQVKQF